MLIPRSALVARALRGAAASGRRLVKAATVAVAALTLALGVLIGFPAASQAAGSRPCDGSRCTDAPVPAVRAPVRCPERPCRRVTASPRRAAHAGLRGWVAVVARGGQTWGERMPSA
ncbi:hypothetical protein SAMN05428944_0576 [Streptomyces sp. 1222.5]|nr:hypothetical protein BX260_7519 [Streptomyces sp. 5112.2]SEB61049.1 hypothetical protein SAMN05428944_0576 [Streptomyces sp. 1222.5]